MASPPTVTLTDASTSFDNLPKDVLSAVLQLLPAKELCRLRTVCKSWCSLTSDAAFITAHADRHKEPLFLAKFKYDETNVHVMDLSSNVFKRIARADGGYQVMRTRLKLACLATEWNRCHLLNPATGRVRALPLFPVMDYADGLLLPEPFTTFFALGLVASTGEYKLLRCWRPSGMEIGHRVQVLTINGGNGWRPRPGPRSYIDMDGGTVVDGVVYFLNLPSYFDMVDYGTNDRVDDILSFDLATEEWRRDLHGPLSTSNDVTPVEFPWGELTLADLKGSLVLAHHRRQISIVDLWFLHDFERGLAMGERVQHSD